jgi:hypothetical protein
MGLETMVRSSVRPVWVYFARCFAVRTRSCTLGRRLQRKKELPLPGFGVRRAGQRERWQKSASGHEPLRAESEGKTDVDLALGAVAESLC